MNRIFEKVRMKKPRMSAFDLSHDKKMSLKMGALYPCFHEEVLPGDQFSVRSDMMIKLAPMVAPVMHNIDAYIHYFFVPNRIVWDQWEEFITGGEEGTSVVSVPTVDYGPTASSIGKLGDYFGLPPITAATALKLNALPFRAYTEIWNEYYRDQNLTDPIDYTSASWAGTGWRDLLVRCWEKDYFTSALPWAQRGPEVTIPMDINGATELTREDGTGWITGSGSLRADPAGGSTTSKNLQVNDSVDGWVDARLDNANSNIELDIRELRRTARLQEFFEKAARIGSRYKEQIMGYFGQDVGDARLDRPEYLGGGKQPVVISEVLNTSATATEPQGNMAGHGLSVGSSAKFKQQFREHGHVIGILSVIPRTAYWQGIDRRFTRDDRFDYFWPEFANLGEQEVKNHELYQPPAATSIDEGTFGYQQRYAEYKHKQSSVHGDFKDSLKFWQMGREFSSAPALNETFVTSDPTDRIFAVQDGTDTLYAHVYHDFKARRPIPYFSDPKL